MNLKKASPWGVGLASMALALGISIRAAASTAASTPAPVNILTFHDNNLRTGHNSQETILKPANVRSRIFGKLFSYPVDGYLYAEPLYVSGYPIAGGTHNVVYAASEHDSVYAFDADDLSPTPLWQTSFLDPASGIVAVPASEVQCSNLVPEIGITGTPVISLDNQALYVVSETFNQNSGAYDFKLHALDLATGAEKFGGPVEISASVPGTGDGSDGSGQVAFEAEWALQRPALLLANGTIYIAFASNCDRGPYHGWVLAYDALTLALKAAFNATPNGRQGGIWQSGNGPAASRAGNIFVGIGNGTFDSRRDYGDSFVELNPALRVLDYFTPFNQQSLDATDADAGITGAVLLPNQFGPYTYEMIGGVKIGRLYLLERGAMGRFCQSCGDAQTLDFRDTGHPIFDVPAFAFGMVFLGGADAPLRAWSIIDGRMSSAPVARGAAIFGYPGASVAASSNGALHQMIWALDTSGYASGGAAVLHAYWAPALSETYNSNQAGARDTAGPAVKFAVPTVANGKVYVGTQTELDVYGLLP